MLHARSALIAFAVLAAFAGGVSATRALGAHQEAEVEAAAPVVDAYFEEVFFATLEGLYRDGVPTEAVDGLLLLNDQGQHALFVGGCEICLPVLNALLLYRARPAIEGYKGDSFDTFGPGLAEADRERAPRRIRPHGSTRSVAWSSGSSRRGLRRAA